MAVSQKILGSPYIGVTGFMSAREVEQALEVVPHGASHKLMVGVLASSKTLRGERAKFAGRYPRPSEIKNIFVDDPRVVNLVHFATDRPGELYDDLLALRGHAGRLLHGFQLNMAWPSRRAFSGLVEQFDQRIVLQVGTGAIQALGSVEKLPQMLLSYAPDITDILIDLSGGYGKVPNSAESRGLVDAALGRIDPAFAAFYKAHPQYNVGVAGGFDPTNVDRVFDYGHARLSIDAEGRLRDDQDRLDIGKVRAYLTAAFAAFANFDGNAAGTLGTTGAIDTKEKQ